MEYIVFVNREFQAAPDAGGIRMDGKRYFRDCCKQAGLDCDSLFQLGRSSAAVGERLSHRFNCGTRKDSQIFAVCYVEKKNVYAAWSLKAEKASKKSHFSVKWADVDVHLHNGHSSASKAVEFQDTAKSLSVFFHPKEFLNF